jgi:hypothetical protein
MKPNEELAKKYYSLFSEEIKADSPVSESIQLLQPKREFKPIMTEEEFNKVFGDME